MATTQKFKTGDEVEHKSGGPKMIVKIYEPKDGEEVVCEWFDGNTLYEKAFHQDVLIPYVYRSPISWISF